MKMALVVLIMGGIHQTKPVWGTFLHNTHGPTDLFVVDNTGKEEGQTPFFDRFISPVWPGKVHVARMIDNVGVVKGMQYAYEHTDHDILAFIHNDVYIYKFGWDTAVKEVFAEKSDIGLLGFFGAEQVVQDGHRGHVHSNMLEAEVHGGRLTHGVREVAVLDGLCMIASRKMLDARHGFDTEYDIHHFYDLDTSLESLDRGYKNYVLPLPIHHQSGQTACQPIFQEWANKYMGVTERGENKIYMKNRDRFMQKWVHYLPFRCGTMEWGRHNG